MASKDSLRRGAVVLVTPVVVYALLRPVVSTDALALAIAAAIPILYSVVLALARRRVDPFAGISAVGFSVACLVSVLTGDSSLPLKLHEAFVTFGVGVVLVLAALIRRPLPIGRLLRTDHRLDGSLGSVVGGFLILHALLHFALAVSLSTGSYLVAGRAVSWGTIALGVLALAAFRRRSGA
jgi:uncharacterized membrane protein